MRGVAKENVTYAAVMIWNVTNVWRRYVLQHVVRHNVGMPNSIVASSWLESEGKVSDFIHPR